MRALPGNARVHRWARRIRVENPMRPAVRREMAQVQQDLAEAVRRLAYYGMTVDPPNLSRSGLTRLQITLLDATAESSDIGQDEFLQQFRKHLHLLLDH